MAKMMLLWQNKTKNKKLHVSAYIGQHQVFTASLLKSVIYLPEPRGDVEI